MQSDGKYPLAVVMMTVQIKTQNRGLTRETTVSAGETCVSRLRGGDC